MLLKIERLQIVNAAVSEDLGMRIGHRFLRLEKISAENFAVSMHQVAMVFSQKFFTLGLVVDRKLIPGHARFQVMREMQIVIEEHQ